MKEYTIRGKTYIQDSLVMGQAFQLIEALKDVKLPQEFLVSEINSLLGNNLHRAMAVVLTEKASYLENPERALESKDIEAFSVWLKWNASPGLPPQVVEDFFIFNPNFLTEVAQNNQMVVSVLTGLFQNLPTSVKEAALSSQEEILQNAAKSGGKRK